MITIFKILIEIKSQKQEFLAVYLLFWVVYIYVSRWSKLFTKSKYR